MRDLAKHFALKRASNREIRSVLYFSVSEYVLRPLKQQWNSRGYGIKVKPGEEHLTNLRFADDILLISHLLESMTQMLADLSIAAANAGLALHPEKTKILRNKWTGERQVPKQIVANDIEIEMLGVDGDTK